MMILSGMTAADFSNGIKFSVALKASYVFQLWPKHLKLNFSIQINPNHPLSLDILSSLTAGDLTV